MYSVYFAPYIEEESPGQDVWYKTEPWLCHTMLAALMFCFQSPIFWMFIEEWLESVKWRGTGIWGHY